jgi:putative salt-induced outer membrane protein
MTTRLPVYAALLTGLVLATPAHAALPDPVKAMIDAAIASGDKDKVATVIEFAKQTNPDDTAEIDAMQKDFLAQQAELAKAKAAEKEKEIRSAGLFENWHGKGEIGANQSSGNSENIGVSAALTLQRDGIDWKHKLRVRADYQRSNGQTSREQFLAAYEPQYRLSKRAFVYGLAQWDRDELQGISSRYAISGGLGYKVIDGESVQLAIKAGPAYRLTDYSAGNEESRLAALFAYDFDWKISDRLALTQNSNMVAESGSTGTVFIDSRSTTFDIISGLEAKVSDRLTTRLSYEVKYDSNPPAGKVKTDTLSRFTLVYGF